MPFQVVKGLEPPIYHVSVCASLANYGTQRQGGMFQTPSIRDLSATCTVQYNFQTYSNYEHPHTTPTASPMISPRQV